ncbi:hypothetical protein [Streptomyces sp. NPDC060184]|uniref:hypothetical protein n=1 Tax=Streptomyces sp. NPDC060184 TaxID=3347064 RepID=UPI003646296F
MSHIPPSPVVVREPATLAVERLTDLLDTLTADLDEGRWGPGPLERAMASRLLVACAEDGRVTSKRLRETAWEGSLTLTHAGGGRLSRLLARLDEVTTHAEPYAGPPLDAALRVLERVRGSEGTGDDRS